MNKFPKSRVYCKIPEVEVTTAMINRSNSTSEATAKQITESGTVYVILEIPEDVLESTRVFDTYTWYNQEEIKTIIQAAGG